MKATSVLEVILTRQESSKAFKKGILASGKCKRPIFTGKKTEQEKQSIELKHTEQRLSYHVWDVLHSIDLCVLGPVPRLCCPPLSKGRSGWLCGIHRQLLGKIGVPS